MYRTWQNFAGLCKREIKLGCDEWEFLAGPAQSTSVRHPGLQAMRCITGLATEIEERALSAEQANLQERDRQCRMRPILQSALGALEPASGSAGPASSSIDTVISLGLTKKSVRQQQGSNRLHRRTGTCGHVPFAGKELMCGRVIASNELCCLVAFVFSR